MLINNCSFTFDELSPSFVIPNRGKHSYASDEGKRHSDFTALDLVNTL